MEARLTAILLLEADNIGILDGMADDSYFPAIPRPEKPQRFAVRQHPGKQFSYCIRVYDVTSCTKESLMMPLPKGCLEPIGTP